MAHFGHGNEVYLTDVDISPDGQKLTVLKSDGNVKVLTYDEKA